jgi:signal transduction histidine kinase
MYYSKSEAIVFIISMSFFILLMIYFIVSILFFVQKKQRKFHTDLLEAKTNYDIELYKVQSEIQEHTSEEISRELHDNVGQNLSLARLGLSTLELDRNEEAKTNIDEISGIIGAALDDLRILTRCMNSEIIKNGGLIKSINMQVSYIQRGGKISAHLEITGEPTILPDTKEIFLFRIVQEAINNIIRHSKASDLYISLEYAKKSLILKIRDNGTGFILNNGPMSGLYNMRRRAKIIDAEFEIDSRVGDGTCIKVITPF